MTSWQLLGPAAPAGCAETRWSAVYQLVLNTPCPGDPPGTLQSAAAHPGTAQPGSLWPGNLLSQQLRLLADSRQVPLQSHHTVQGKGLLQHRFLVLQDQALQAVEGCSAQSTLHVLGGDRPARAAWLSGQGMSQSSYNRGLLEDSCPARTARGEWLHKLPPFGEPRGETQPFLAGECPAGPARNSQGTTSRLLCVTKAEVGLKNGIDQSGTSLYDTAPKWPCLSTGSPAGAGMRGGQGCHPGRVPRRLCMPSGMAALQGSSKDCAGCVQACLSMHLSDEAPVSGRAGAAHCCIANRHVLAGHKCRGGVLLRHLCSCTPGAPS